MTTDDGRITLKRRAYSCVPDDILTDGRLSCRARVVLAWMIGRPDGWRLIVGHVRKTFSLSEEQWRKTRAELAEFGFWRSVRSSAGDGRFTWEHEVTDVPYNAPPSVAFGGMVPPSVDLPGMESSSNGRASDGSTRDIAARPNTKTNHAVAALEASGRTYDAAAIGGREKRRSPMRSELGIECWYVDEDQQSEAIALNYPAVEIRMAVSAIRSRPNGVGKETSPVPHLVVSEIEQARAAAAADERRAVANANYAERLERAAPADLAAKKRGEEWLARRQRS